ncbi:MAG TPA: acyl-CoA dehydrogenase family protein, partial [Streptosporangiaceae bacterium]|nr:acyl-CoA dehydrogenase family protein [Streptosporangiaceae bacterium]
MDVGKRGRRAPPVLAGTGYRRGRRSWQKGSGMAELSRDEQEIVELVRDFVNREVKPVVRDLEHSNAYPDKLIAIMKELGVYGL